MPAAEVEFNNRYKSLDRIINLRHGQQRFWMCHEAIRITVSLDSTSLKAASQTS